MHGILLLLIILVGSCLIVGIIEPKLVIKGKGKKTIYRVIKIYGILFILIIIILNLFSFNSLELEKTMAKMSQYEPEFYSMVLSSGEARGVYVDNYQTKTPKISREKNTLQKLHKEDITINSNKITINESAIDPYSKIIIRFKNKKGEIIKTIKVNIKN